MFFNQQQVPQQYGYNYNPQMFNTMGYGVPQRPKGTNGLTMEQAQELQQSAGLNLMPTKEEYLQAICTHRDLKSGQNVLVADETGSNLTCPICASQFEALNMTEQDVKDAVKIVVAYEPIWAIGTGKVATSEQANEVCKDSRYLRKYKNVVS